MKLWKLTNFTLEQMLLNSQLQSVDMLCCCEWVERKKKHTLYFCYELLFQIFHLFSLFSYTTIGIEWWTSNTHVNRVEENSNLGKFIFLLHCISNSAVRLAFYWFIPLNVSNMQMRMLCKKEKIQCRNHVGALGRGSNEIFDAFHSIIELKFRIFFQFFFSE